MQKFNTLDTSSRSNLSQLLGPQAVFDKTLSTVEEDGFYSKEWTFSEHIGTHMEAPGHFAAGGALVDELSPAAFIAPSVVIDIREKAAYNANAIVEPADLIAFARRYGRIPRKACVAMNSGWDEKVSDGNAYQGGTGLGHIPPRGATLFVGVIPWKAGSGGPCRVLAYH